MKEMLPSTATASRGGGGRAAGLASSSSSLNGWGEGQRSPGALEEQPPAARDPGLTTRASAGESARGRAFGGWLRSTDCPEGSTHATVRLMPLLMWIFPRIRAGGGSPLKIASRADGAKILSVAASTAVPIRVLAAARAMTCPHQFEDLGSAHRIPLRQLYFKKSR